MGDREFQSRFPVMDLDLERRWRTLRLTEFVLWLARGARLTVRLFAECEDVDGRGRRLHIGSTGWGAEVLRRVDLCFEKTSSIG